MHSAEQNAENEIHVSGDVSLAMWQTYQATRDHAPLTLEVFRAGVAWCQTSATAALTADDFFRCLDGLPCDTSKGGVTSLKYHT